MDESLMSEIGKLSKKCLADSEKWFPNVARNVPHMSLSMCGEVGEFANLIKKIERGDLDIKSASVRYRVAMELTDVFIYLMNLAALLQIDLVAAYDVKRLENQKRWEEDKK